MNDPVDRIILERQALDGGFRGGMTLSGAGHGLLLLAIVLVPLLQPKRPLIVAQDVFVVSMPPGGGGTPAAATAPPAAAQPVPAPSIAPKVEPPPKVIKPPTDEPRTTGLPKLDAKRTALKPQAPRAAQPTGEPGGAGGEAAAGIPGLQLGPGIPGGTDWFGDWYMASVQRRIWLAWQQSLRGGTLAQPITISFTILADGNVSDVVVAQSGGAFMMDQAAQRAVLTSAPFGPLPKDYGKNRVTIQAIFKPTL